MVIRNDIKAIEGLNIRKMLGYSVKVVELHVVEKKIINLNSLPAVCYVKDKDNEYFLVLKHYLMNLIQEDHSYIFIILNDAILGIVRECEIEKDKS